MPLEGGAACVGLTHGGLFSALVSEQESSCCALQQAGLLSLAPPSTHTHMQDAYTGSPKWQFAIPEQEIVEIEPEGQRGVLVRETANSGILAPLTMVNGVLLVPSIGPKGTLYALNAQSGALLSSFELGASSNCGPAVVNGTIYSGSGYKQLGLSYTGNTFWALTVPSQKA